MSLADEQIHLDLFDQVPVPYHELNIEGRISRVNAAECALLGYESPVFILGKYAWELVSPEDRDAAKAAMHRKLSGLEALRPFRRNLRRQDGTRLALEIYESLIFDDQGRIAGIRSILIDRTKQDADYAALERQVELRTADLAGALEEIRKREERFRLLFASNPHPMWVYDRETLAFVEVNHAAEMQYGYSREEFLRMRITDIRPEDEVPPLHDYLRSDRPAQRNAGEWRHSRSDGKVINVRISSHEIQFNDRPSVLVLAIDVTSQKLLEQQFRQAQKMEAIGRLAGGVAHDFNNLLTVISGYGTMLAEETDKASSTRASLDQILRAAERATALTRQLLVFSRHQTLDLRLVDLNEVVRGIDQLTRRLIGDDLLVHTHLEPNIGRVKADPNQLEQVLLNLLVNARDAMPQGGKITIETGEADLDHEYVAAHAGSTIGRHVFVAVSDTGVGMDAETQTKIFEPFFTTKEVGKGTGLGLSTVYGIVTQHNGNVWVYSEPNVGSTFKIYLPLAREAGQRKADDLLDSIDFLGGSETILLVEDDLDVRVLCAKVLERLGYHVIVAEDVSQALDKCRQNAGPIDLLLTDVVMPGLDGRELAAGIVALRPGIKTLFCSGYTGEAFAHRGAPIPKDSFLQKPYTPRGLALAVRKVLSGS